MKHDGYSMSMASVVNSRPIPHAIRRLDQLRRFVLFANPTARDLAGGLRGFILQNVLVVQVLGEGALNDPLG